MAHYFSRKETEDIRHKIAKHNILPVVYSFVDGIEYFSYIDRNMSIGMGNFINQRKNDVRRREVKTIEEPYQGDVFYFTCIGDEYQLPPINDTFKSDKGIYCLFHKDIYSNDWWNELLPAKATKATAALELKAMLGCERLIVFGDGQNDMPLFSVADESYAMSNAVTELKEIATAVIDASDNDGVAKWIERNAT